MCIWSKIEKYINKDVGEAVKEMYQDTELGEMLERIYL